MLRVYNHWVLRHPSIRLVRTFAALLVFRVEIASFVAGALVTTLAFFVAFVY
jgi:hypothetical protein